MWLEVGALDNTTNADYGKHKTQASEVTGYLRTRHNKETKSREIEHRLFMSCAEYVRRGHAEIVEFAVSVRGG